MPSAADRWNRKLHLWVGLFSLSALGVFFLSGLVLNHPKWNVAGFWKERVESNQVLPVSAPSAADALGAAREVMSQVGLRGEISQIRMSENGVIRGFRVTRPGSISDLSIDFSISRAGIKRIEVNAWGAMNMLHSFTGVRRSDPALQTNGWATWLWRVMMDAVSAGVILLVLSGIYLWYGSGRRRRTGLAVLAGAFLVLLWILWS